MKPCFAFPGGAWVTEPRASDTALLPERVSAEARLMARAAGEFVRQEVLPCRARLEAREPGLLRARVQDAGRLGLLAGSVPENYGGLALTKAAQCALAEAVALEPSFAITLSVAGGVALLPLLMTGTAQQKRDALPLMAAGERIGAFALSEAGAGSDALRAQTRAVPLVRGKYALSGLKLWVTNGGIADVFTVFARVPEVGLTAFLVPADAPGVALGPEEDKLGLRASSTRRIALDDVRVPASGVLGTPGQGHKAALSALNPGRLQIAAVALGMAKTALREAARHAAARRQFGQTLGAFGLVQAALGTMTARIFGLESSIYRLAGDWDRADAPPAVVSEEYALECALLKFWGTETLAFCADQSLQLHGGYGFTESYPVARLWRDARVFRIFEGANDVCRLAAFDQLQRRLAAGRIVLSHSQAQAGAKALRLMLTRVLERLHYYFQDPRQPSQEAQAAIADMMAGLYAAESAHLRAEEIDHSRYGPHKLPNGELARAAVAVLIADEQETSWRAARSVTDVHAAGWPVPRDRSNPAERHALAQAALDCEGYPF